MSSIVKTVCDPSSGPPRNPRTLPKRADCSSLYHRSAEFSRALAEIDALLSGDSDNDSLKSARGLFAALAQHSDQSVARRQRSTIRYRMNAGNLFVPISIRGRAGSYIVDTGANFSVMSESEAKRLGLAIHEGGASVTDITGGTIGARTAWWTS